MSLARVAWNGIRSAQSPPGARFCCELFPSADLELAAYTFNGRVRTANQLRPPKPVQVQEHLTFMRPLAKATLVGLGYIGALAIAFAAVSLYIASTDSPDRKTYAAMFAFGDSLLFLAIFGVYLLWTDFLSRNRERL